MAADRPRLETRLRSTFGLKRLPFSKDLESDELFVTDVFTQSLDRLRYLVDRRGTGVVFGAPGTGKSTLLRAFLGALGKATYSVCYVSHSTCAVLDLFREIAREAKPRLLRPRPSSSKSPRTSSTSCRPSRT